MVNPLGNATARGQMTRALVANISVREHFLWDDFWPSNGQKNHGGGGCTAAVRPFSKFFGGVWCCVVVFVTQCIVCSPIFYVPFFDIRSMGWMAD